MKKTGAKIVIDSLKNEGVKHIFSIPGVETMSLFDAAIDSDVKIVTTTHESASSFMADAYSRVTNEVGVCLSISGPGVTNMITGIAEAYLDSSPMIVIIPSSEKQFEGKSYKCHEINHMGLLTHITKEFIKIQKIEEIQEKLSYAFYCARSKEMGPVVVELQTKILDESFKPTNYNKKKQNYYLTLEDQSTIKSIAKVLDKSKLVGLYLGSGAFGAKEEIIELAEKLSAPVCTTISGKGAISEDHKLSVGFGLGGRKFSKKIFDKCDTILAIGCKFSEVTTIGYLAKVPDNLIHIDINPDVLNKNYISSISLCADSKLAISEILKNLKDNHLKNNQAIIDLIEKESNSIKTNIAKQNNNNSVSPEKFFSTLRTSLNKDAILTTDCGNHQLWAFDSYPVYKERTFITPIDFQSMGFGLPAAIAVKLAFPQRQVASVCGDGCFRMSGFEILTAIKEKINPIIFIFNDNSLNLIKLFQNTKYGKTTGVDILNPDFKMFSQACGANYFHIANDQELKDTIKDALDSNLLAIVEVNVSQIGFAPYVKERIKQIFLTSSPIEKAKLIAKFVKNKIKL